MKRNPIRPLALLACLSLLLATAALATPAPPTPATAPDLTLSTSTACPVPESLAPQSPATTLAPQPLWLDGGKCATCAELLKACKAHCGAHNINYQCNPPVPCAGTCTCIVPPA